LRWSIGVKLTIAFLALAIIPMSATAYYNLTQGQRAVAEVTTENMMELSHSTAQRIEGLLVENQRTSATLAGEPLAAQFLAASEDEREVLSLQVYQMLQNFADTHPDYDAPGLLDANGIVVALLEELLLGKDRSFRDYFQASIQGQPYVSSMLVGRATGRPGVFLTNPVATQQEALARLEGEPNYDLVLTDLHLPDGDGLALLAHVRERGLPLAVVVVTGRGDEEAAVAALKAGADDYVVKGGDYLARASSILSSPPKSLEKAAGWGWPRCTAS
jgi:CheY-like chemotaxis protein